MAYVPPPLIENANHADSQSQDAEDAPLLPGRSGQGDHAAGQTSMGPSSAMASPSPLGAARWPAEPQQQQAAPRPAPPPPGTMFADLPDVRLFWQQQRCRTVLYICLANSVMLLLVTLGEPAFALAMLAGILGAVTSAINITKGLQDRMDMASRIRLTSAMSASGLLMSVVTVPQLSWIMFITHLECELDPAGAPAPDCVFAYALMGTIIFLVLVQAVLFKKILDLCAAASRLLNPVSSGMVSLA